MEIETYFFNDQYNNENWQLAVINTNSIKANVLAINDIIADFETKYPRQIFIAERKAGIEFCLDGACRVLPFWNCILVFVYFYWNSLFDNLHAHGLARQYVFEMANFLKLRGKVAQEIPFNYNVKILH